MLLQPEHYQMLIVFIVLCFTKEPCLKLMTTAKTKSQNASHDIAMLKI